MSLNEATLNSMKKNELVGMIMKLHDHNVELQSENADLKKLQTLIINQNERLERLEKSYYSNLQYQRRGTIEISGIPLTVSQENLEQEVINIYKAADALVDGKLLEKSQIQACHRVGKSGVTICKFVNRKYAVQGLYNERNLKDKNLYGVGSKIYINASFCKEYRHLNYLIRNAKKANRINRFKVKHGVNMVQLHADDDFVEITHKNDLIRMNIIDSEE